MDDYSKYYYQRIGSDKGDFGDISDRVKLRKDLECKSFQWYLDNIFPELVSIICYKVIILDNKCSYFTQLLVLITDIKTNCCFFI